jgi:hypothetical protein
MPYTLGTDTFRSRLFFHRSLEGAIVLATSYMLEFGNDRFENTNIKQA